MLDFKRARATDSRHSRRRALVLKFTMTMSTLTEHPTVQVIAGRYYTKGAGPVNAVRRHPGNRTQCALHKVSS